VKLYLKKQEVSDIIEALEYFENDLYCNPSECFPEWHTNKVRAYQSRITKLLEKLGQIGDCRAK
jgi:hypothetical protein